MKDCLHQKGQSTVEYALISLIIVTALLSPLPGQNGNNAIQLVTQAIQQHYAAYKYAHSMSTLPL